MPATLRAEAVVGRFRRPADFAPGRAPQAHSSTPIVMADLLAALAHVPDLHAADDPLAQAAVVLLNDRRRPWAQHDSGPEADPAAERFRLRSLVYALREGAAGNPAFLHMITEQRPVPPGLLTAEAAAAAAPTRRNPAGRSVRLAVRLDPTAARAGGFRLIPSSLVALGVDENAAAPRPTAALRVTDARWDEERRELVCTLLGAPAWANQVDLAVDVRPEEAGQTDVRAALSGTRIAAAAQVR